jgi:hypothetical protein
VKATGVSLSQTLSEEFASCLDVVAGIDGNIRGAVVKSGLREIVWATLERFPDEQHELSEWLELMSQFVRDRDQSCGGDQHRRDVCASLGIQADSTIANSGFPRGVAVRERPCGAGARGLRPFLSAVVDRRHNGECVTANLTPKFTFNLIQRSAVSRILCSAMERE